MLDSIKTQIRQRFAIVFQSEDEYREIQDYAQSIGLDIRSFIKFAMRSCMDLGKAEIKTEDCKILNIPVDNYQELLGYVKQKKFGSVESFATFAMAQYMARFCLTEAQKQRVRENIENQE